MMSMAFAMMLTMAAAKADPQDDARKAFNNCLFEEHNSAVSAKKSASSFNEDIQKACAEKRKTYFDIIVKNERGYGSSQKDAEEYANEEIQAVVDSVTSAYGQNLESGATLIPEK